MLFYPTWQTGHLDHETEHCDGLLPFSGFATGMDHRVVVLHLRDGYQDRKR